MEKEEVIFRAGKLGLKGSDDPKDDLKKLAFLIRAGPVLEDNKEGHLLIFRCKREGDAGRVMEAAKRSGQAMEIKTDLEHFYLAADSKAALAIIRECPDEAELAAEDEVWALWKKQQEKTAGGAK